MRIADRAPLFEAGPYRCHELMPEDAPALQRFYESNPEYSRTVEGEAPRPEAALEIFKAGPPPGWPFDRKWLLGFTDRDGSLVAMADVITNLLAEGVWHVGLFIVATTLHGSGAARTMYDALEAWMKSCGARWSRLGVVTGNDHALRFWTGRGYVEVRVRRGVPMGKRVNDIRVMMKPLAGGTLPEYLAIVERDRIETGR